jgi:hypothetical protein
MRHSKQGPLHGQDLKKWNFLIIYYWTPEERRVQTFTAKMFKQTECPPESSISGCWFSDRILWNITDFSVLLEPGSFLCSWETVILRRRVLFHQVSYSYLRQGSDGMSKSDSTKMARVCIWCVWGRKKKETTASDCGYGGGETRALYSWLI